MDIYVYSPTTNELYSLSDVLVILVILVIVMPELFGKQISWKKINSIVDGKVNVLQASFLCIIKIQTRQGFRPNIYYITM